VVFERVSSHKGTDAAHVYGGMVAVITGWAEARAIPYDHASVSEIKKFATGSGGANKEAVIRAMKARGLRPEGDDEADAQAIWLLARERFAPLPRAPRDPAEDEAGQSDAKDVAEPTRFAGEADADAPPAVRPRKRPRGTKAQARATA
jgi:hypothetical protein